MTNAGEQDLRCSEGRQFRNSLMHLDLRRELKEDYMKGERKQGGDWVKG